jgi:hypothetical protein
MMRYEVFSYPENQTRPSPRKMGEAASVAVQVFRKVGEREDY